MDDRRREPRSRPSLEFSSRRNLPNDMPLHSKSGLEWRSTRPGSGPYFSSALLARQPWKDPRAESSMDFEMRHSEYTRRPPSPRNERRPPPFDSSMRGDGGGDGRRPYSDEHDELSLESYDYRSGGCRGDLERFGPFSDRARRPLSPPPFDQDRERPFGYEDRSRHFFGPSRPCPGQEPFGHPEHMRDRPFGPQSPRGCRPRFGMETDHEAPPGAPNMRRGDGNRGHPHPPDHRGTPPNDGSWRPRPFGIEHSRGIPEGRPDSLPFRGGWRDPCHPSRCGPNREDLRDNGEECSQPPHFRQMEDDRMDFSQCPPDSSEYQDWDLRQRPTSNRCEQQRDYDRWDPHHSDFQEHGQERPDVPYFDEGPPSFSSPRENAFRPVHSEGNSRGTGRAPDQQPLPGMRGPRDPYIPRNLNNSHSSHSGLPYEGRQQPNRYGTRPFLSKSEERGDADHFAAPGRQELTTDSVPPLPNLQKSHKEEGTANPEPQEQPRDSGSIGWSNRRSTGEAGPPDSGFHEGVDAGCPWPNRPKTNEDRTSKSDCALGPINAEGKAQVPLGPRGIQVGSQGLPATVIPSVQLPSPSITQRPPLVPGISQQSRGAQQAKPDFRQQLPVSSGTQQQQSLPAQNLLPSASADQARQCAQSRPFIGNIPKLPTLSEPPKPPPICLDSVESTLSVKDPGDFKEEKPPIPSDLKLQPPPSPPWLRGCKELGFQELLPSFQIQTAQADAIAGPQYQISSGNDKKSSTDPIVQQPPQLASKVSCGPQQPYGPDYPPDGQQPPSPETLPRASSLPELASPNQPSISPAPQEMASTSADMVQQTVSMASPLKNQEPRPLTTAYPKVRFSLPPPLLAQAQARFPPPASQEGSRACAPHVSVPQAKPTTCAEAKQTVVSATTQKEPEDQPSAEKTNLEPPPGIPSFLAGSLQGPKTAGSVPQPSASSVYPQGQQPITAVSQKQCSPAAESQGQVKSVLPSSNLGGGIIGKLKEVKSQSSSDIYGPKVPEPSPAVQMANTSAQCGSSEVKTMDIDADGAGPTMHSDKSGDSVADDTLPTKKPEQQSALMNTNQADASKKNDVQSQNTGLQNKIAGLKKLQPLIMKRPGNQIKKAAESKNPEGQPKKQGVVEGSEGSSTKCDPGTAGSPKPLNGTSGSPSKDSGSGVKSAGEHIVNQAASVTKQKSPPTVNEETLKAKEKSLMTNEDKTITTNKEEPSCSEPVVNDQEVSSSTPECSDEGASVSEGKTAGTSEEQSGDSSVTVKSEDNRDKKRKLSQDSSSSDRRRDTTSDSEESEYSSSKKSYRSRSPSPKKASRASRAYSSDDYYDYTDTETRGDPICLSGRGNEGQIFGIPVVFKAISTTRTFWNIRGSQVSRDLEEIVGENVVNQKINRAGFLCVNVATAADAVKLLNITKLGGANVEAVIPSMYLKHEAKIRGVPYHYTNEQLTEYFSDVGVVGARRQLTVKRLYDGSFEEYPRSSVILTFKPDATLPRMLELGPDRFFVEEYIEAPLQCIKCLRFGHTARDCVSVGRCKNCGARYCQEDCERKTPTCANCFGPHPATYVGCPRRREVAFASLWKKAFDINAL